MDEKQILFRLICHDKAARKAVCNEKESKKKKRRKSDYRGVKEEAEIKRKRKTKRERARWIA